uniref:Peptidase C39 domain-containing protein n=1 Tax=viral metagenome TaxID=1070528 RepID=A0A6C0ET03_9ZZZZ
MTFAHFFPLKGLEQSLKCHQNDCGVNVLYFLGIIPRKKALYIADTTDAIYSLRIETFLTNTYGVPFRQEKMWTSVNGVLERPGKKMIKLNSLNIPEQHGVIIFMINNDYGHFAVIGKIEGVLYYIDPQSGIKHLLLSKETDDIISQTFDEIFVYVTDGPATRNTPNIEAFHHSLLFNKTLNEMVAAKNKPYFGTVLKHGVKGVIKHHNQLIKGKKYQIIDKVTEQPINIGIFDKKIEGASFIIKHVGLPDEEFGVSMDDNKFIRIKDDSLGSAKQKRNKWSYKTRKTKSA